MLKEPSLRYVMYVNRPTSAQYVYLHRGNSLPWTKLIFYIPSVAESSLLKCTKLGATDRQCTMPKLWIIFYSCSHKYTSFWALAIIQIVFKKELIKSV